MQKSSFACLKRRATVYSETFVSIRRTTHNQVPNSFIFCLVTLSHEADCLSPGPWNVVRARHRIESRFPSHLE